MAVTAEEMDMQNQALLEQDQGDGFDEASAAPVLVDDGNMPAPARAGQHSRKFFESACGPEDASDNRWIPGNSRRDHGDYTNS